MTHGPLLDRVRAEITLEDGSGIVLEASRIAEARERRMRVVYPSGEVEIDFVTRAFRNTTPFPLDADFTDTPAGQNPLAASVEAFVAAVRGEAAQPAVTGEGGDAGARPGAGGGAGVRVSRAPCAPTAAEPLQVVADGVCLGHAQVKRSDQPPVKVDI